MKTKFQIPAADYKKLTDEELVHRFVQRKENIALNYLFERYGHIVFGICLKYMDDGLAAKNAVEDIFIKLTSDLKRYTIEDVKSWLFKYVLSYNLMKTSNGAQVNAAEIAYDNDNIEVETDMLAALESSIELLGLQERLCIEFFYLHNKNYTQVAMETGYPIAEVKRYLHTGKHELRLRIDHFHRLAS